MTSSSWCGLKIPRVAIVGGGWSGLAAAVDLVAAGADVTIFEAGRVFGGRARSVNLSGRSLDNGQHVLLGAYRDTLTFIKQVGGDPDALFLRAPLSVTDNAGFSLKLARLPAPFNLALGLLFARGVSLVEKIKTAKWMRDLENAGFRVDSGLTVSAWLDASGPCGVLRRSLWEPLCLAALNTPANHASAQIFANVLRDSLGSSTRSDTDVLIPRYPLGEVFPELAKVWLQAHGADIHLGQRVRSLDYLDQLSVDGESFDGVIVAVGPQHAAEFLPNAAQISAFEPIATVYLEYAHSVVDGFENDTLRCIHTEFGAIWVVLRVEHFDGSGEVCGGCGNRILSAVFSGHGQWESASNDELSHLVYTALGFSVHPIWSKVIREKRATFSCTPNLHRPPIKTGIPSVWQVGDYTWPEYPGTIEGAVRSGREAARQIIFQLKRS